MSNKAHPTWNQRYRLKLKTALSKLGGIGTLDQIVTILETMLTDVDVKRESVRQNCESCCLNKGNKSNYHRRNYDPEYHFLLKIAPGLYALPDGRYLDLPGVFRLHHKEIGSGI